MIILDTHVLIWWVSEPQKLSQQARERIKKESEKGGILISSISVWEIYLLVKLERLKLTMDTDSWLEKIESLSFVQFIPIDNKIAAKSVNLQGVLHDDPADRFIIATAKEKGAQLLTSDVKIREYPYVQTFW